MTIATAINSHVCPGQSLDPGALNVPHSPQSNTFTLKRAIPASVTIQPKRATGDKDKGNYYGNATF